MRSNETLSIILILIWFLAGFIPMVMGIVYYARENRRLDREYRKRVEKAAARHV